MADRPPVSVLLPTTRWTDACGELAAQLGNRDELLLIHDVEDDPITEQNTPAAAGSSLPVSPNSVQGRPTPSPPGWRPHATIVSSGRTMIFTIPPDWLATLSVDYEEYGPVSEVPYFVGRDPLSIVLEPLYASSGSLGIYLGNQ